MTLGENAHARRLRHFAFNGDADGLCAVQQLRLAQPGPANLVTGVKRDITLLRHLAPPAGDRVFVLDVSLHENRGELMRLLDSGIRVTYFDHHRAGAIPAHPGLDAHIDESADVCTSILVDRHLEGRYRRWAVVAAFGDNLTTVARAMAEEAGLTEAQATDLERLGVCLNYNAYGESVEDLHFNPAELSARLLPYTDPFAFMTDAPVYEKLRAGYEDDMAKARGAAARVYGPSGIVVLPNAPWARRAIGVLINELARERPNVALAILSPKSAGGYTVSVRVPPTSAVSAADFCKDFPTGGGRKSAGGINHLPDGDVEGFAARFEARFRTR
ncbi:MAG TPA: DHH family phosphoesterase [Burkholderiales bacterium]